MNSYEITVSQMDSHIYNIIDGIANKLCYMLENEQNIIDGRIVSDEVRILNSFLKDMFDNGFSKSEAILEEKMKHGDIDISSLASNLFCNKINDSLKVLLERFENDIMYYTIIYDRMIFINKLFSNDKEKSRVFNKSM